MGNKYPRQHSSEEGLYFYECYFWRRVQFERTSNVHGYDFVELFLAFSRKFFFGRELMTPGENISSVPELAS